MEESERHLIMRTMMTIRMRRAATDAAIITYRALKGPPRMLATPVDAVFCSTDGSPRETSLMVRFTCRVDRCVRNIYILAKRGRSNLLSLSKRRL